MDEAAGVDGRERVAAMRELTTWSGLPGAATDVPQGDEAERLAVMRREGDDDHSAPAQRFDGPIVRSNGSVDDREVGEAGAGRGDDPARVGAAPTMARCQIGPESPGRAPS